MHQSEDHLDGDERNNDDLTGKEGKANTQRRETALDTMARAQDQRITAQPHARSTSAAALLSIHAHLTDFHAMRLELVNDLQEERMRIAQQIEFGLQVLEAIPQVKLATKTHPQRIILSMAPA